MAGYKRLTPLEYAVAVRDATRVCAATLPPEQRTIVDDDGAFRDLEAMRLQLDRIAGDENGARRTPAGVDYDGADAATRGHATPDGRRRQRRPAHARGTHPHALG